MGDPRPLKLIALKGKFRDFDLAEVYHEALASALKPNSQNFVVQFGASRAKIAVDLEPNDFEDLLYWTDDDDYPIRWV